MKNMISPQNKEILFLKQIKPKPSLCSLLCLEIRQQNTMKVFIPSGQTCIKVCLIAIEVDLLCAGILKRQRDKATHPRTENSG